MRSILVSVSLLFLVAGSAGPAGAKDLFWRQLEVRAVLEADGTLRVAEHHAMVFSGDWNGGERIFRVFRGQSLGFDGVARQAADGSWRPLTFGSLDLVDHWNWHGHNIVRWRSRLPTDPEFSDTEIGYRLQYRLTGVLEQRDGVWLLDHDFAFPDRTGSLESFRLELELDPVWSAGQPSPLHLESGPLPAGVGQVVTLELRYVGAGAPTAAAPRRIAASVRGLANAIAALGAIAFLVWAAWRDRAVGRWAALPSGEGIDRAWIERHILTLPPEEIGAAWDRDVGAAEVAALLARLQLEGKIASRVEKRRFWFSSPVLHMELRIDRGRFNEVERRLIDRFFPQGDRTDTDLLRKHYRRTGFDPAGELRAALEARSRGDRRLTGTRPRPLRLPSVLLLLGGIALLAVAVQQHPQDGGLFFGLFAALFFSWAPAYAAAFRLRNRVAGFVGPALTIVIGLGLGLFCFAWLTRLSGMTLLGLSGGLLVFFGLARTVATCLQTREDAVAIARRRELARARAWLLAQLRSEKPDLDDAWTPYLIAFGLTPQMDRWFRAFGGATASTRGGAGGGFGGSGGGTSWTGGGGAFGGAGATASWAMAATAMSSTVSAASSSGSGGGGGGSSGGGGGGGW